MGKSSEQTTIAIDRTTVAALEAQAAAKGLSLQAYLRVIAGNGIGHDTGAGPPQPSAAVVAEFDEVLDEFFKQNPRTLPPLPPAFSRADVYDDRD